ncbi:hypothetical protein PCH_Pc22g13530 [Penicillium rubens Wisconsin 54-1255]|uniref:Uncharacterized protein n=1 Tax=Penicillium rubens (strain ATCC 28089 / DSM 1075 / NRRL 1951 / Wisconsin 54-1255) TaxID=500485 RepID=B6HTK6_PENRW|nr:hypothetical protein PCH_Pc22g13530 [Penicillium rubens Wisconsin 54-1255]
MDAGWFCNATLDSRYLDMRKWYGLPRYARYQEGSAVRPDHVFEDTRGAKACANWEEYNKGCGRRHGFSAVQFHGVDDQWLGLLAIWTTGSLWSGNQWAKET